MTVKWDECVTLTRVRQPTALRRPVAASQFVAALLWLLAVLMPPSVLRVPDIFFDVLAPLIFAVLLGAGVAVLLSARPVLRPSILVVGTALCALLVAVQVALNLLIPTLLPGF